MMEAVVTTEAIRRAKYQLFGRIRIVLQISKWYILCSADVKAECFVHIVNDRLFI